MLAWEPKRDSFPLACALLDLWAAPYSGRLLRFVANLELLRTTRAIPSVLL